IEDSHVTLTPVHSDGQQESSSTSSFVTSLLNPIIDSGMESIFTTASSSVAPLPSPTSTMTPSIMTTTTTASQPPIPPTPIPSEVLQNLPTFESVFRFEDRVKSLEVNFSEFMRTNQSPEAVSNIPTDLSEMELKKILIDKMEGNKSIQRSDEQRNLYKALVEAYEADKTILNSYGESAILKRRREDNDDQEGPSAGSDWGSKRQRKGREHASASTPSELATKSAGRSTTGTQSRQLSATESAFAEEPVQTTCQMEEPSHPVFETGAEDQPIIQTYQHPEWFSQPRKPPTSDRDWNKTLPAVQGNAQSWISALAKQTDARSSFNELLDTPIEFSNFIMNRLGVDTLTPKLLAGPTYELMRGSCNKQTDARSSFNELLDTPIEFSNFIMNRLGVDTLTPKLLAGPTYELMRGSCNSLTELEYHLEEVYKATTDQLDWVNPEGQQYPHNLLQPLPLIPDNRGRRVIPFAHFINNDLEYLWGDYGHIKWIEDLFYGFAVNRESTLDVYSKRRIIVVTDLKIVEWHNYKHLDWISVRRDDDKIYKFKECDFKRLRLQDIEDMLLFLWHVEDHQLGVKSYQKRLNLTKPDTYRSDLKQREAYTAYSYPRGFIYQNKDKKNRLMRIDELHKFSDGMLNDVRNALDDRLKGIRMQYLLTTIWKKRDKDRAAAMIQAIDKMLKTRRIMRSLERFVGGRQYEGDFRMLQRTI
nr:hypothetical protein [Tanacetum cinerariifolium]